MKRRQGLAASGTRGEERAGETGTHNASSMLRKVSCTCAKNWLAISAENSLEPSSSRSRICWNVSKSTISLSGGSWAHVGQQTRSHDDEAGRMNLFRCRV